MKILTKIIIGIIVTCIVGAVLYALVFDRAQAPQTIHENLSTTTSGY